MNILGQIKAKYRPMGGFAVLWILLLPMPAFCANLTLELTNDDGVVSVGALNRWDQDGNPRKPINPKAAISLPQADFAAVDCGGGQWLFKNLPPGRYDLLIMGPGKRRIEGWHYPPVLEFDPFFGPETAVEEDVREFIVNDIKKSRHYENKVAPLAIGGGKTAARVLVMLVRDLPTSYTKGAGTIRFEIWQYTWKYGGWAKENRTRLLHRILLPVNELRQWRWLWEPRLGGIEMSGSPKTIRYEIPGHNKMQKLAGLQPNI